jgi:hypothetical protein
VRLLPVFLQETKVEVDVLMPLLSVIDLMFVMMLNVFKEDVYQRLFVMVLTHFVLLLALLPNHLVLQILSVSILLVALAVVLMESVLTELEDVIVLMVSMELSVNSLQEFQNVSILVNVMTPLGVPLTNVLMIL